MSAVTAVQIDNAKRMILSIAAYGSESADKFSNWLAIGFSAILSLFIGNIDKLRNYIDIANLKIIALLYIAILFIVLIQKRIFFAVQAAHKGRSVAQNILRSDPSGLDPEFTTDQIIKSSLWIMQRYIKKRLTVGKVKAAAGDPLWNERFFAKLAQWQQWLAVIQASITIYSAYLLAISINT